MLIFYLKLMLKLKFNKFEILEFSKKSKIKFYSILLTKHYNFAKFKKSKIKKWNLNQRIYLNNSSSCCKVSTRVLINQKNLNSI